MKRLAILLGLGLIWTGVRAESHPGPDESRIREIAGWLSEKASAGHPIADRTGWERLAATSEGRDAVRAAETLVGLPLPDCSDARWLAFFETGDRQAYQVPYYERTMRTERLVLAEALKDRGRFLPDIIRLMSAICDERVWILPAHDKGRKVWDGRGARVALFSAARALYLGRWVGTLGDRLPPDLVRRVRGLVRARVTEPFLACCRLPGGDRRAYSDTPCSFFFARSNWNAVCMAGAAGAVLALEDDRRLRAEAIEACERSLPAYLAGFGKDGWNEEGVAYWNFGFGNYLFIGLMIREATGGKVDLFVGERVKKCAAFAYESQLEPGVSAPFADGIGSPSLLALAYCRQIWPDVFPASAARLPPLGGFDRGVYISAAMHEYAYRAFSAPSSPVAGEGKLPRRTFYPQGQVLISRLAPDAAGRFAVAVKGGGNGDMHNHNDLGSYVIAWNGRILTGDPGGEWYTARTFSSRRYESKYLSSYGHPVPRVNGCLQAAGGKYRAKIVSTDFSDDRDEIVFDLMGAYPSEAKIAKLTRTLVFDRRAPAVTVTDAVELREPGVFETPLVTHAETVATAEKSRLFLTESAPADYVTEFPGLRVDVTAVGGDWHWETDVMANPYKAAAKRLSAVFDRPVASAQVIMRFTACQVNGNE